MKTFVTNVPLVEYFRILRKQGFTKHLDTMRRSEYNHRQVMYRKQLHDGGFLRVNLHGYGLHSINCCQHSGFYTVATKFTDIDGMLKAIEQHKGLT